MFTMWPQSPKCGRHSRVMRTSPLTFVPKTRASSSSLDSSNGARPSARPALLKRMLITPSCSTAAATNCALLSGSVTSSSSATSVSSRSTRRAPPATRTPAAASARAVARPIPDDAPVTIAVLPLRSRSATRPMLVGGVVLVQFELHALRAPCEMVDLERRVMQVESLLEEMLEPAPRVVAVDARRHENVRRERGKAARHRPDMQVVHLGDVRVIDERAGDVVGIDTGGRSLEKDPARLADQRPARTHHQGGDEQACDRIEAIPAREEDECARQSGAGERRKVGRDVQERSLHVEARAVGARE